MRYISAGEGSQHHSFDEIVVRSTFKTSAKSRHLAERAFAVAVSCAVIAVGSTGFISRVLPGLEAAWSVFPDGLFITAGLIFIFWGGNAKPASTRALPWWIIFVGMAVLSWLITVWANTALATYGIRAISIGIAVALIVQRAGLSRGPALLIRRAVLFIILLNMLFALRQSITGLNADELSSIVAAGSSFQVGEQTRLIGLLSTGQDLSVIAGASAVWCAVRLAQLGFKSAGALVGLVAVSSSLVALLVLQRSALVGIVLAVLYVLVRRFGSGGARSGKFRWSAITGVCALLVAALIFIQFVSPDRFQTAMDRMFSLAGLTNDYSFAVRQQITLPVSLDLAAKSPLGYGVGASGPVADRFINASPLSGYPLGGIAADNGYIFIFLQLGVFGTLAFALMLLTWVRYGGLYEAKESALANSATLVFICGIMLSGTFWALTAPMIIVFVLISCEVGQERWDRHRGARQPCP